MRSGFIGLLGPTNSGKSTLLNALVGEKLSIVSPKVQTTYHCISGVVRGTDEETVLIDVPGFQSRKESVSRLLNRVAERGVQNCHAIAWVFSYERALFDIKKLKARIEGLSQKRICLLNKVDLAKEKTRLLPIIEKIHQTGLFGAVVPISALKKDGLKNVKEILAAYLEEGPAQFPEGELSNRSQQFLVSEYIREQVYRTTGEEIPYSVRVEIETWEDGPKVIHIGAILHIDAPSRKKILIGKGGLKLKEIGVGARKEIERLLGRQVCLKLFVDVEEGWKENRLVLSQYLELNA